jgi:NAD(P)-dependent dehydrogenase (short-subunit alcohol dehydrogenase family)
MPRTPIDITLPDLTGRRAVLTGGSDGIGLRIATRLALAGAELLLPVRNPRKGEAAIAGIRRTAPSARISLRQLDLSSLESVNAVADTLRGEGDPIHLMVNNAGVMTPPTRQTTVDGFESQFGVNHLGHFALVAGVLPLLQAGRARVTSQVSVAASQGAINWDDLNWDRGYHGMHAYSQSKIAFGLFGLELHRRSVTYGWGISSNLSHPGIAPTSLLSARPELGRGEDTRSVRVIRWLSARGLLVGTPETAALPALYAATAGGGGQFYGPKGPGHIGGAPAEQKLFSRLGSEENARRIWQTSEELTGATFPPA